MVNDCLIQKLKMLGMIAQITNEKELIKKLTKNPIKLYCGFDPTSDSLHVGHLIPLICLKRFQLAGHFPIILIGGATGLIGDPSFKTTERKFNSIDIVHEWIEKIKHQILQLLDFDRNGDNKLIIVDNYDWFSSINVLDFLRDIGKYFSINQMINKEAIKQRLNRNDKGISFTEFSYNLLQGYDFAHLYACNTVTLQIGGSDQWGNITSGIDLIRRLHQKTVYGLTTPLITKADGTKFGKIEDGTIWLDPNKTSPYKFYQFWINTSDNDVYRFLKLFTFLSLSIIESLRHAGSSINKNMCAQYILAEEVTKMVHGDHGLTAAKRITDILFNGKAADLTEKDFLQLAQDGILTVTIKNGIDLQQALVIAKFVPSRTQARTMIMSNAISINNKKQLLPGYVFSNIDRLYGRYTLLQRGKKNYCLLKWQ